MSDIFTFVTDFENIDAGFSHDQPTTYIGRVKINADGPTVTGGNRPGALNLGFRVRDKQSGDVIFEDRAFLLASTLTPDHWTGFTINIPALDRTVHDAQLMLDFVREAELLFPANADAPIAATLALSDTLGAVSMRASFDWRERPSEQWAIAVTTGTGSKILLSAGGAQLSIDGETVTDEAPAEYTRLYREFAALLRDGRSNADARPLRLVADAFLVGRRFLTDAFRDPVPGP